MYLAAGVISAYAASLQQPFEASPLASVDSLVDIWTHVGSSVEASADFVRQPDLAGERECRDDGALWRLLSPGTLPLRWGRSSRLGSFRCGSEQREIIGRGQSVGLRHHSRMTLGS